MDYSDDEICDNELFGGSPQTRSLFTDIDFALVPIHEAST